MPWAKCELTAELCDRVGWLVKAGHCTVADKPFGELSVCPLGRDTWEQKTKGEGHGKAGKSGKGKD